jgi:hypothetical protein
MDQEAPSGASGFEHGTVAGVLWQKGPLRFAARSLANSRPVRVGKEPYFHLRSIAPSETRVVPHGRDVVCNHRSGANFRLLLIDKQGQRLRFALLPRFR